MQSCQALALLPTPLQGKQRRPPLPPLCCFDQSHQIASPVAACPACPGATAASRQVHWESATRRRCRRRCCHSNRRRRRCCLCRCGGCCWRRRDGRQHCSSPARALRAGSGVSTVGNVSWRPSPSTIWCLAFVQPCRSTRDYRTSRPAELLGSSTRRKRDVSGCIPKAGCCGGHGCCVKHGDCCSYVCGRWNKPSDRASAPCSSQQPVPWQLCRSTPALQQINSFTGGDSL